jgi:hypothetical protein
MADLAYEKTPRWYSLAASFSKIKEKQGGLIRGNPM